MRPLIFAKSKFVQSVKSILRPIRNYQKKRYEEELKRKELGEIINFFSQFLKKGSLCFDVGANNGLLTEIFIKLGAKVIAIEPQIENIKIMQEKFKNNKNVILVQKGISDKSGQGELLVCNYSDCSTVSKEWVSAVTESGRLPTEKVNWDNIQPKYLLNLGQKL